MEALSHILFILLGYLSKLLVGVLAIKLVYKFIVWHLTPLNLIPGPRSSSFLVGSFLSIRNEPFMEPQKRWWKEAGTDTKLLHFTTILGRSSILVLDKDILRDILTAPAGRNDARFEKRHEIIKEMLGEGLITLEGAHWMRHRRIIQPSFSSSFLNDMLNSVVPSKAKLLVEFWKKAAGREIDVASHMSAITLDIIGDVAFSHSFHGMDEIEKWVRDTESNNLAELQDPFISAVLLAMKPNLMTILFFFSGLLFLNKFVNPRIRQATKLIKAAAHQVVTNARNKCVETNKKSLLQLLLHAEDQQSTSTHRLSHAELMNETTTFLVAGHETTSTWCYWALFALSKHPDIQEKVFTDVSRHCSTDDRDTITLEMVDAMEYFHAFLQEVLRLYPPVGMFVRTSTRKEIMAGYTIPQNTRIVIPVHLLHRHPHYWDEPDVFKPERWLDMNEERIRFAFIPFSAGGRNCIGQRFATIEAKLILAPLIRNFRFQVAPSQRETDFTFSSFITMKSNPALKIVAQSRR